MPQFRACRAGLQPGIWPNADLRVGATPGLLIWRTSQKCAAGRNSFVTLVGILENILDARSKFLAATQPALCFAFPDGPCFRGYRGRACPSLAFPGGNQGDGKPSPHITFGYRRIRSTLPCRRLFRAKKAPGNLPVTASVLCCANILVAVRGARRVMRLLRWNFEETS